MQLRFQDKEHFFHDTARMLQSGLPLQRAWEQLGLARDRAGAAARAAAPLVNSGLDEALQAAGFSIEDREILAAGEQSGRLVEACQELTDFYAQLSKGRSRVITASLYPVFILHLGAILLSIAPAITDGSFATFLSQAGLFLGIAYAIVGGFVFVVWLLGRQFRSHATADAWISRIPVLGGFFRDAALSRFCLVLSLGIRSADGVLSSLNRAGRAARSARLGAAAQAAVLAIRSGSGFAEALAATACFPADLERAFHVADASGRLESEIKRWADIYRTRFFQRIESLAEWLPRLLYMMVVGLVAFRMFDMVSQINGSYSKILDDL